MNVKFQAIAVLSLLLFVNCLCYAAPSITGISWGEHGGSATISGGSFGSKTSAAPLKYDDFEDGTIGNDVGDGPGAIPWYRTSSSDGYNPKYSNIKTRISGEKTALQDFTVPYNCTLGLIGRSYTSMYVSGWFYTETGGNASRIWKWVAFRGGGGGDWNFPNGRFDVSPSAGSGQMYPKDCTGDGDAGTYAVGANVYTGSWHRFEVWIDQGTPSQTDGEYKSWRDLNVWGSIEPHTYSVPFTETSCPFTNVYLSSYFAHDGVGTPLPWLKIHWSEVYIDITQARVEIGNASTWSACTHREIQIPTAWSSSSVQVTVNQGAFNLNDTVYVYVVDSNGDYNTTGYPVSISGDDVSPPSLTNILPTNGSSTETASQTLSVNANDSTGVSNVRWSTSDISYAGMGSGADMAQSGNTWTEGVTLSIGSNTYYFAAIDTLGNATTSNPSTTVTLTAGGDTTDPVVTAFVIPATSSSLTFDITTFTASDAVGVTGYLITESATPPSSGDTGWSALSPTSYTADSDGVHTLYAWSKDAAGNVSDSLNDAVTITIGSLPGGDTDFSPTGDTYLNVNDTNYSTETLLRVYAWPSDEAANTIVLVFDTSAYLDQGIVHSATLKLYIEESGGDSSMDIAVAQLNVDPVVTQATGEIYATGTDWIGPSPRLTAPFSELGLVNIGTATDTVPISATLGQYKNFDVTDILVKIIAENDSTCALLVYPVGTMSANTYRYFSSQDHATSGQRPKLTVTFQHAGGSSVSGGEVK